MESSTELPPSYTPVALPPDYASTEPTVNIVQTQPVLQETVVVREQPTVNSVPCGAVACLACVHCLAGAMVLVGSGLQSLWDAVWTLVSWLLCPITCPLLFCLYTCGECTN